MRIFLAINKNEDLSLTLAFKLVRTQTFKPRLFVVRILLSPIKVQCGMSFELWNLIFELCDGEFLRGIVPKSNLLKLVITRQNVVRQ